jgi:D-alanyl-D-alanine carboxypeptidase/D-alanyl-D-alanine-endopeptidase (penicillin-binding protein 4)
VKLLPRCLAASLLIALAGWPAGGVATSGPEPGAGRASSRPAAPAAALDRQSALAQALAREVEGAKKAARALGVHVVDLADRKEVYAFEADHPRILASNTKLLTTAAALAELGPDFEFETRVLVRGDKVESTLEGDLAIVGSGDPNLSGRFHEGDAYAVFRPWARALRERGITKVNGDLVLVNGIFEEPRIHPDWPRDQLTTWYEAPVEALSFSDNCVLVRVRPGRAPGAPALVETVPRLDYFRFRNTTRTGGGAGRLYVTREDDSDTIVISGSIPQRSGPVDVWVAVYDPTAYFAAALRAAFAEEGVGIAGVTQAVNGLPGGVWEQLTSHTSDLATTLAVTNKRSQNFYAECLAKLLGHRLEGRGSWPAATAAVTQVLSRLGLPPDQFPLADGSGLSRADQASARALTTLLAQMYFHAFGRDFVRSLPFSGEADLAWRRRLADPPYRGNVYAKTGTLSGVSALSGYAKATSGRVYAFSILCNQVRSNAAAHVAQDRIVRALIDRG